MENNNSETGRAQFIEQSTQVESYTVTATRVFEMDFSKQQLEGMMRRTGADTPSQAIEDIFLQKETDHVEPEQKLIGADVQTHEPSNDDS